MYGFGFGFGVYGFRGLGFAEVIPKGYMRIYKSI